jgi:hypothetical protein
MFTGLEGEVSWLKSSINSLWWSCDGGLYGGRLEFEMEKEGKVFIIDVHGIVAMKEGSWGLDRLGVPLCSHVIVVYVVIGRRLG